jgi:hypothetical protein
MQFTTTTTTMYLLNLLDDCLVHGQTQHREVALGQLQAPDLP